MAITNDGKVQITLYMHTGYNVGDVPANDSVIAQNQHYTLAEPILLSDPGHRTTIRIPLPEADINHVDYLRVRALDGSGQRWFYWIFPGRYRHNVRDVDLAVALDVIATVGLENIGFFGHVVRRSLSATERQAGNYALLPEPWAPRRPLMIRRMLIDLNQSKTAVLPSHISDSFETETTPVDKSLTIQVPSTPLSLATTPDSLSVTIPGGIPMGYPNIAGDTQHTINTPWGSIEYTTPFEQYFKMSGAALRSFLENTKKYNSLDLLEAPYYLPSPPATTTVQVPELQGEGVENPKASRHYTTITIRSLAADNQARTYGEQEVDLEYQQELTVVVVPDRTGGLYLLPRGMRAKGATPYTYLEGVYSPFETVTLNAVGDTPGKFASDGTNALHTALTNLFQTYINKMNALQMEQMQAKYFKDIGTTKGQVMTFVAKLFASEATAISITSPSTQTSHTDTTVPQVTATNTGTQNVPSVKQTTTGTNTTRQYQVSDPWHQVTHAALDTTINQTSAPSGNNTKTTGTNTQKSYTETVPARNVTHPAVTTDANTSNTVPAHSIGSTGSVTTPGHVQKADTLTNVGQTRTETKTTSGGGEQTVQQGNDIAINGISATYASPAYNANVTWGTLQTLLFGGYRNETHGFMLGNINDYLNRWASIQNDLHNGKVANLFKNVTLQGAYAAANKLAGKYEIIIASLHPDDEQNFDIFLDHFGHSVDEYSNQLAPSGTGRTNFDYVMVGEDALVSNDVLAGPEATGQILARLRGGIRIWKTLIRAENF